MFQIKQSDFYVIMNNKVKVYLPLFQTQDHIRQQNGGRGAKPQRDPQTKRLTTDEMLLQVQPHDRDQVDLRPQVRPLPPRPHHRALQGLWPGPWGRHQPP